MPYGWMWGLKKFNENNHGAWCIPKKGTKEYYEVYRLMGGTPPDQRTKTTKPRAKKEQKEETKTTKPKAPRAKKQEETKEEKIIKPKAPRRTAPKAPSIIKRLETKEEKAEIAQIQEPENKKNKNNYLEFINKKYKTTNLKNLEALRDYIIKNFIDTGFIKNYRFTLLTKPRVTKSRLKKQGNPYGNAAYYDDIKLKSVQAKAKAIHDKYIKAFNEMIKNPVVIEVLSNYIVYNLEPFDLIDLIDTNDIFKASFSLTYKLKSILLDTQESKQKIIKMVKDN